MALSRRFLAIRPLLDVVDQREQLPLAIDFALTPQRESSQPFVVTQIAEHRLHRAQALAVACTAVFAIDPLAHALRVRVLGMRLAREHRHLTRARRRFAQTLRT